jgi:hypothetical protein
VADAFSSIDRLRDELGGQVERLKAARSSIEGVSFYPYDILANVVHLDAMLTGANRDLDRMVGGWPVADIGAADGDLAFALEAVLGWEVDIIDAAATNCNGLRGASALRDALGSQVAIHDIDLDREFRLPRERYGFALMLGLLYHLQSPLHVLGALAERADHCLLSTRVAQYAGRERTPIAHLPIGYLVGPTELNVDPTNYWILSQAGLERLVQRAGWTIEEKLNVGDTMDSDPVSAEHDERCFMLLRSPPKA